MTAQTPIKCFVRLDSLFFAEDYAGTRVPIGMAADSEQADWLAWTLERAHNRPVKPWGYTDFEQPEPASLDHSPGCFGGRGEVSKTCPACNAERDAAAVTHLRAWSAETTLCGMELGVVGVRSTKVRSTNRRAAANCQVCLTADSAAEPMVLVISEEGQRPPLVDLDAVAASIGLGAGQTDKAPDGAPWYAHLDGPCGPSCEHAPDGGNHPTAGG